MEPSWDLSEFEADLTSAFLDLNLLFQLTLNRSKVNINENATAQSKPTHETMPMRTPWRNIVNTNTRCGDKSVLHFDSERRSSLGRHAEQPKFGQYHSEDSNSDGDNESTDDDDVMSDE